MRGLVSDAAPGPVGTAYRVSGPVPALFHEDPLFLELCAAFDELVSPFVVALDCFPAYLDPWLAPADFLGWLAALAGARPAERDSSPSPLGCWDEPRERGRIAGAVSGYRARGTAEGLRAAAAVAAGVPPDQVSVTEGGAVTWADAQGESVSPAFDPTVTVTVRVPAGSDAAVVADVVREAAEPALPVFSQLRITVEES
jgi:phage tail-like protein